MKPTYTLDTIPGELWLRINKKTKYYSAFILYKSRTDEKVLTLIAGCGESKIMTMCLIYLLSDLVKTSKKIKILHFLCVKFFI